MSLQLDGNKLLFHLDRVNPWKRGESIYPIYIAFSPTSYCNHKCIFCVYHYKEFKPIFFPLKRYEALALEWKALGVRSLFFAGDGDPLLNKSTPQMVEASKKAGIDIALNTNGRLLNDESIRIFVRDLTFIRISMNAGSSESYAKIHGTQSKDFEIVLENIEKLVAEKKRTNSNITIGIQCVLLSSNVSEIKPLSERLKKLGVNYLAVKPFLKHPEIAFDDEILNLEEVLDELSSFSEEISDKHFKLVLRKGLFLDKFSRSYKQCLSTDFMIEVDAVGDIYSCGPYIGKTEHKLGNIMEMSFSDAWNSEQGIKGREFIRCGVDVSSCMPFCRPHSVNETLWQIKNPPAHINYI